MHLPTDGIHDLGAEARNTGIARWIELPNAVRGCPAGNVAAPVLPRMRTTTTRSRKAQARIVGCLDGTGHGSLIGFATPLLYCWKPEASSVTMMDAGGVYHLLAQARHLEEIQPVREDPKSVEAVGDRHLSDALPVQPK